MEAVLNLKQKIDQFIFQEKKTEFLTEQEMEKLIDYMFLLLEEAARQNRYKETLQKEITHKTFYTYKEFLTFREIEEEIKAVEEVLSLIKRYLNKIEFLILQNIPSISQKFTVKIGKYLLTIENRFIIQIINQSN